MVYLADLVKIKLHALHGKSVLFELKANIVELN